jgi:hypothetical protein
MRILAGAAAAIGVAAAAATPAQAWNCRGHMIVAAIAWQHIDPAKHARLKALLELNPNHAKWLANAGSLDPTQAMFIQAACWPDDIKSAAGYQDPPHGQPDPYPNRNIGYADLWRHREWHYKDIPFSPDHTKLVMAPNPTAETQIVKFRAALASTSAAVTDDIKSYDLAWLIHLVGDVHQPLHATSRFIAADKNGDGGGNDVCLGPKDAEGRCDNLHGYWDGLFGSAAGPETAAQYAATTGQATLPAPSPGAVANAAVAHWLAESEQLARTYAYAAPIKVGLGPYDLHSPTPAVTAYHANALAIARAQVSLAGARLAKLINDNLK